MHKGKTSMGRNSVFEEPEKYPDDQTCHIVN